MSCVNYIIEKKLVVQLINFLHFRFACISEIKGIVAVSWNPSCENKIRSNKLLEAETLFSLQMCFNTIDLRNNAHFCPNFVIKLLAA